MIKLALFAMHVEIEKLIFRCFFVKTNSLHKEWWATRSGFCHIYKPKFAIPSMARVLLKIYKNNKYNPAI
jgi:hypothetical protein